MAIRINLLTEALAEEDLRRRDPVKRAIFLGLFVVVLSLVWFSSIWLETKLAQNSKAKIEDEIQTHNDDYNRVLADLKKISEGQRRLAGLQQLSTNRFLQGNLLNALQQVYVANVQLTRVTLNQACEYKAGVAPQTNSYGTIPGRPASSTEHITLTLDAKDSSPNPGDQVNRYKDAVTKLPYFQAALSATNGVRVANIWAPQTAFGTRQFVPFTLECRFPDKTR